MKCDHRQLSKEVLFWCASLCCLCGGMALGGYPFKEAFSLAVGFLPGALLTAFFSPRGRHSEKGPFRSGLIILSVASLILAFAFEGFIASILFFDRYHYGLRGFRPFSENPIFISAWPVCCQMDDEQDPARRSIRSIHFRQEACHHPGLNHHLYPIFRFLYGSTHIGQKLFSGLAVLE